MIKYNPAFLDNTDIFNSHELKEIEKLSDKVSLNEFLDNRTFIDKFGLDFIYTSALIEGNTYDKLDTQALIEYGRTAGGKKYSDAKMILNLRDAYELFIAKDLKSTKKILKELHFMLSNEMVSDSQRGTPRDKEVTIAGCDYIPLATKEKLEDELNYLFKKADIIKNPFNKAVYLHNNLAYLQYFSDCNKRTARVMLNIALKDGKKMIFIPDESRVREYLQAIVKYYESGDHALFKAYFIDSYKRVIDDIIYIKSQRENEKSEGYRECQDDQG